MEPSHANALPTARRVVRVELVPGIIPLDCAYTLAQQPDALTAGRRTRS
jgi:hypothetical protein